MDDIGWLYGRLGLTHTQTDIILYAQLAVGYALRNTIDAGAPTGNTSHPLRQLFDPLTSPM